MSAPTWLSGTVALVVGAFQVLANGALLLRGRTRVPAAVAAEGATTRISNLLHTAWVYGMLGNLCVSVVLLFLVSPLRAGDPLARQLATVIGVYYSALGVSVFSFAPVRSPGMLIFSGMGLVLLGSLWL
ncbi:MAG: hypothetical protein ACREBE_10375 [bacterium]